MRRIDRLQPLLIMLLFAAPFLAAWIVHGAWHPGRPDGNGMIRDLRHLLRASKLG